MEDEEGIIGCLYYKIKQNSIKYKFKRSKLKYDILTQTIFFLERTDSLDIKSIIRTTYYFLDLLETL